MKAAATAPEDSGGTVDGLEPAVPVAHREDPRRVGPAEEEVGKSVLVDIACGNRAVGRGPGHPGVGRRLAERSVAHVLEEQRRTLRPDQQQIDVAAVVEVCGDDGDAAGVAATFASLVMSVKVPLPLFRSS